jgi:chromosome segregation ATPase
MSSPGDNIVLEHLRHIRTAVDETRHDIREIKARLGTLEQQYANMSNRIDRTEYRLERIETRIGLIDA